MKNQNEHESTREQVREIATELILDALENGNARETIAAIRNGIKAGFNQALDDTGASENGFRSWKFTNQG